MAKKKHVTIPAGEFKQKCLALIDQVAAGEIVITVTKHGKQKVKITTALEVPTKEAFGSMAGTVLYTEDLTEPEDEDWESNTHD